MILAFWMVLYFYLFGYGFLLCCPGCPGTLWARWSSCFSLPSSWDSRHALFCLVTMVLKHWTFSFPIDCEGSWTKAMTVYTVRTTQLKRWIDMWFCSSQSYLAVLPPHSTTLSIVAIYRKKFASLIWNELLVKIGVTFDIRVQIFQRTILVFWISQQLLKISYLFCIYSSFHSNLM